MPLYINLYTDNMNNILSQKEIGKRISDLRKIKGLSQSELSNRIELSRSSITQIELGKRSLDTTELQKLSLVLGFSMDDLISDNFMVNDYDEVISHNILKDSEIRISIPKLEVNKFQNILLYILEKCAGKPNVGETVLYKLLYFSDFNYYELYEEHLTGSKYRKLPFGPVPQKIDVIINQMINSSLIQRIKTEYYGLQQTRYIPLQKSRLTELKASEKDVVDNVINQMSDWSASVISNYSHKDLPWLATKEGEEISYELAFYREAPYSVRLYDSEE